MNAHVYTINCNLQTKLSSIEYLLSCNRYEHLINDKDIKDNYYDSNIDKIKNIKKYHDQYIISIAAKVIKDFMTKNKYKSKRISTTDLINKYYKVIDDILLVFIIDEYAIVHLSYMLVKQQNIEINTVKIIKMIDVLSYEVIDYIIDESHIENISNYYDAIQEFYHDDKMTEYVDDEKCQSCGFKKYCEKFPNAKVFDTKEQSTKIAGVIFE